MPVLSGAQRALILPAQRRFLLPACSRNMLPLSRGSASSAAGNNARAFRRNNSLFPIVNPVFQGFNAYYDAAMSLVMNNADVTWAASLEIIGDPRGRMSFTRGGQTTWVCSAAESFFRSDPMMGVVIPPGAAFRFRTWQSVAAGGGLIGGGGSSLASLDEGGAFAGISTQPNQTLSGGPAAVNSGGANGWVIGTSAALAGSTALSSSMVGIGDSIDTGLNETSAYTGDADGNIGAMNRWAAIRKLNTLNLSRPSSRAAQWAASDLSVLLQWIDGIAYDWFWSGLGRNDYAANFDGPAIKANVEASRAKFRPSKRFILRDAPPTTTGDGTTVEGQTRSAGASTLQEGYRQSWKGILQRREVAGMTDYFPFAQSCEATKADGTIVWPANGSTDLVHPTGAINEAAVAAAIAAGV